MTSIRNELHARGLGILAGRDVIKTRNTRSNEGKSVDFLLRELVADLAEQEREAEHSLSAAQDRLREAWAEVAVPFTAGFLEAWAMVLEFLGHPIRTLRWRGRRPARATLTGHPVDAAALFQIAAVFDRLGVSMEAGQLSYKSGGISFSGKSGEVIKADLVLNWEGEP